MSKTADALRLSAARAPIALGEMSADDILAGLNAEQKATLAASLKADAATAALEKQAGGQAADDPAPDDDDTTGADDGEKGKKKEKMGGDGSEASDSFGKGFAAGTTRALAVMKSEHFEGRAEQAVKLLGNAKLSADEINAMLADMPDGTGQKMLDALKMKNPDLGTGAGADDQKDGQKAQSVWDKAIAANNPNHKAR